MSSPEQELIDGSTQLHPAPWSDLGMIQVATVTITDAQMRSWNPTPIIVIPPTEVLNYSGFPTTLPKVIAAYAVQNTLAGAYDFGSSILLFCGSDGQSSNVGQSAKLSLQSPPGFSDSGISSTAEIGIISFITCDNGVVSGNFIDNAIAVGGDNMTGGNPANTLKVVVYYVVVNT